MTDKVLIHAAGNVILCENDHEVADVIKDMYQGDLNYSSAISWRSEQQVPIKGQAVPLICWCGANYFPTKTGRRIFRTDTMRSALQVVNNGPD